MDGNWYVDPTGRFDGRLFDGDQWTDQVSDGGRLRTDPDWPPTKTPDQERPASQVVPKTGSGSERRRGGNRRQINTQVAVERRRDDRRQPLEIIIPQA